jgi:hypothetical protein
MLGRMNVDRAAHGYGAGELDGGLRAFLQRWVAPADRARARPA